MFGHGPSPLYCLPSSFSQTMVDHQINNLTADENGPMLLEAVGAILDIRQLVKDLNIARVKVNHSLVRIQESDMASHTYTWTLAQTHLCFFF